MTYSRLVPSNFLKKLPILSAELSNMNISDLKHIFASSVSAVNAGNLIRKSVKICGHELSVNNVSHLMIKPCYVMGFGKAVLGMAAELERILDTRIKEGIVSVPTGIFDIYPLSNRSTSRIQYIEGAQNNLPDKDALKAAENIKRLAMKLDKDDLVIILISGGGSALLPLPKSPITLEEKLHLIKLLGNKGADIVELNCVRKKISDLKGGKLAEFVYPAKAISLILSDIVGDPLDFIASGPTVPSADPDDAALNIVKKYGLFGDIPESIRQILESKSNLSEAIPIDKGNFLHVDNFVIGNNKIAAEEAKRKAEELGYSSAVLTTKLKGDVCEISEIYGELAKELHKAIANPLNTETLKVFLEKRKEYLSLADSNIEDIIHLNFRNSKGVCVIVGGEPTVKVTGKGLGGRNQQLALAFSDILNKADIKSGNISFLSCGTDGIDGPTDAAGAIGSSNLIRKAREENIDPEEYLSNNNCYNFYKQFQNGTHLVKIGHTGTNVMDIHILIVAPCTCGNKNEI